MKASTNYNTVIKPLSEKVLPPVVEPILPAASYDDFLRNREALSHSQQLVYS
jgi:hypothetical protein